MISYDYTYDYLRILFTEEGDTLIIDNDPMFGVDKIISFSDDISFSDVGVSFDKYFQYTVDGVNWSEWIRLSNFNLSNINTKYNHVFNIRYKYIRVGKNTSISLYFHSILLSITYREVQQPKLYTNSIFNKYVPFINKESIHWAVNVLNKIYNKGIVPKYIVRGDNNNWQDEDYINLWWSIIYINALKVSYNNVFSDILENTNLVKKLLIQKDIIPGETDDLGRYYYLLTHYYDEIMKRGTVSIFDKQRDLPDNFENVTIRGELLRLCNQPLHIESIFGLINGWEVGWLVGATCPGYNYNDIYIDFIKGFEVTESVVDLNKYPLLNSEYISLEDVEIEGTDIGCMKVNTTDNDIYSGVSGTYEKSILVDNESDYEISFKIKGLQDGNNLKFGVKGYNFLGNQVDLVSILDDTDLNYFIQTNTLNGDLFFKGFIRYKSFDTLEKLPEIGGLLNLKFTDGVEYISPIIEVACNNNVYLYDIKIRNLPVTSVQSNLLYNSELIVKLLDGYSSLTKQQIVDLIVTKLIPIHTVVSTSERYFEEILGTTYLPYTLPFEL